MNLERCFTVFPSLETPRLVLRALRQEDRLAIFQLFSSPEVVQYYDLTQFEALDQADHLIAALIRRYEQRQAIRWAITLRGGGDRLIGTCGFNLFDTCGHFGEIGYDLHPTFWGQGLITEAIAGVLRFGFREVALNRIEANVLPGNRASVRVLTKLGFKFEGLLRQRGYWANAYHDLEWYGLLRQEWEMI
ncbi:MAG: GNAT family N-acetyltransferase [Anaerolineae bacterium]|jgi:ribosomal-protein-alanine N-acetyltransferase|nr:GNAT family N-acetyltransferase [Anaerolineae bacterium]